MLLTLVALSFLGTVVAALAIVLLGIAWQSYKATRPDLPKEIPRAAVRQNASHLDEKGVYDVVVVGAGPSGSTFAWDLKRKNPSLRIILLERAVFPRKKYCGDAWCEKALRILDEMGILSKLENPAAFPGQLPPGVELKSYEALGFPEGSSLAHRVRSGGFISPSGVRCINDGDDSSAYGSATPIRTYAIKRYIIDEWIAKTARSVGVDLVEGCEVGAASLDKEAGIWTVTEKQAHDPKSSPSFEDKHGVELEVGDHGKVATLASTGLRSFKGRLLVLADGSNSYMATKLGLVHTQPDSVCSHQYITPPAQPKAPPTLNTKADGVMLFTASLLPGYSAFFRHANSDIYCGTYVLPGGKAKARWIKPFEDKMISSNPYANELFKDGTWRESKKLAPIRCWTGDRSERSYGDRSMVIGDAAGQVDPLTGEGIHTAMVAARLAADTALEMFDRNVFDERATAVYERRWSFEMGPEFLYSRIMAWILVRMPWLLDSMAIVGHKKGQAFLDEFGEAMTRVKSKLSLLRFENSLAMIQEMIRRLLFGGMNTIPEGVPFVEGYSDSGEGIEELFSRKAK